VASIDPGSYLGLVHYLARRAHKRLPATRAGTVALDDLVQAGFLGLLEAGRTYDANRGVSFVAFARVRVTGAMLDLLGSLDPLTKRERRARRERDATEAELTTQLRRPPTREEVAEALGKPVADVDRLGTLDAALVSLDEEAAEGREPAAESLPPEAATARQELARAVAACLEALRAEMRVVLIGRLLDELTLETLGRLLRGSKDRIWRLERAARQSLRSCLNGKGWDAVDALEALGG